MQLTSAHQRAVTLDRIEKFTAALQRFDGPPPPDVHPIFWQAERHGIESILADLREQVADYDRRHVWWRRVLALDFVFWLAGCFVVLWLICSYLVPALFLFIVFLPGMWSVMRREWRRTHD